MKIVIWILAGLSSVIGLGTAFSGLLPLLTFSSPAGDRSFLWAAFGVIYISVGFAVTISVWMEFKKRYLHLVAAGLFAVPVIIIVVASERNVDDLMFLILLVVPSVHIARYAKKQN
jgi:hypothetical protein